VAEVHIFLTRQTRGGNNVILGFSVDKDPHMCVSVLRGLCDYRGDFSDKDGCGFRSLLEDLCDGDMTGVVEDDEPFLLLWESYTAQRFPIFVVTEIRDRAPGKVFVEFALNAGGGKGTLNRDDMLRVLQKMRPEDLCSQADGVV
jgi:hypothetical protein